MTRLPAVVCNYNAGHICQTCNIAILQVIAEPLRQSQNGPLVELDFYSSVLQLNGSDLRLWRGCPVCQAQVAGLRLVGPIADLPHAVQALIDPVCLMTCYPDLLHNFVYRQPKWETLFSMIGLMDILRYVCSRDLLIAEVRHVF